MINFQAKADHENAIIYIMNTYSKKNWKCKLDIFYLQNLVCINIYDMYMHTEDHIFHDETKIM